MAPRSDWRHGNTGRLLFDSTRRFQEKVLSLVNSKGYPEIRIAHLAVTRHIDVNGSRIADLAIRAGVTKQSIGEMIDQLQAMGLVTRHAAADDRRAKIVVFSHQGRKLLGVIRNAVAACERDFSDCVGGSAARQVREALNAYCFSDECPSGPVVRRPAVRGPKRT
jgi:DNA-binding MarR family transcriptional regulator